MSRTPRDRLKSPAVAYPGSSMFPPAPIGSRRFPTGKKGDAPAAQHDKGGAAMARVFITGSSDGLGLMAARLLIGQGHEVVLHGRNEGRSRDALAAAAGSGGGVSGDLSTTAGARTVADAINKLGRFDAVIHNAGIGYREGRVEMEPGVPNV